MGSSVFFGLTVKVKPQPFFCIIGRSTGKPNEKKDLENMNIKEYFEHTDPTKVRKVLKRNKVSINYY